MLEGRGLVDLIHISAGHYYSPARSHEFSTIFLPHGLNADHAAAVKKAVSIPAAVVGGITSAEVAERIIAEGKADIVSMGRQMIADPDFALKACSGRGDEIFANACVAASAIPDPTVNTPPIRIPSIYRVSGRAPLTPYNVNSFSHHKILPEEMPEPEGSRRVLIIGGGPGGMQTAIDAADRTPSYARG